MVEQLAVYITQLPKVTLVETPRDNGEALTSLSETGNTVGTPHLRGRRRD